MAGSDNDERCIENLNDYQFLDENGTEKESTQKDKHENYLTEKDKLIDNKNNIKRNSKMLNAEDSNTNSIEEFPSLEPVKKTDQINEKHQKEIDFIGQIDGKIRTEPQIEPSELKETDINLNPITSPNQVYTNLLIFEESLRLQYLTLQSRRRKYTIFYLILLCWTIYFACFVLINPSPYAYVNLIHKMSLLFGTMCLGVFHMSGMYSRGMVYSRKFIASTNKGLRNFNLKLVTVHRSFKIFLADWSEPFLLSLILCLRIITLSLSAIIGLFVYKKRAQITNYFTSYFTSEYTQCLFNARSKYGGYVKLVLLPRGFGSEFRAAWESFREEYWESVRKRHRNSSTKTKTTNSKDSSSSTKKNSHHSHSKHHKSTKSKRSVHKRSIS